MFDAAKLQSIVSKGLPDAHVTVIDQTGSGDHFAVEVVSCAFEGKTLVQRHRMVYQAVGAAMGNEIHALSLKTQTPAEKERN